MKIMVELDENDELGKKITKTLKDLALEKKEDVKLEDKVKLEE